MYAHRISVVLFAVVFVTANVFAVQLLLFAQEWGQRCWPGEVVPHNLPGNPPQPPTQTWERRDFYGSRVTDGKCEIDSCFPPGHTRTF